MTVVTLAVVTAVFAYLQIALGGWVSTNYAVLACSTFPACQGSWWPAMDFRQGFELWRPLGMTGAGAAAAEVIAPTSAAPHRATTATALVTDLRTFLRDMAHPDHHR